MTSKLTRERIEWLNYAATGLAANGTEMAMSPQDVIALTECCLAAMDSEPVVFTDERNLHHIVMGRETSLIWGKQNQEAGDIALYRHAQQPVVPDDIKLRELFDSWFASDCSFDRSPEASEEDNIAWRESYWYVWQRCRAAMLQAGNSPVIPDGLIAAVNRLLDSDGSRGCYSAIQCGDAHDEIERLLAAAPQDTPALNSVQSVVTVPGKWIPVSERMPDVGVKVLCFPVKDEPIHATFNGQLWLQDVSWSGSDDPIDNVIPVSVTHWMPLPAAPQEVK
ncbi:DUF551 domain-containing protein [Klebsiella oxytoca]|uniref:DUF551 domain-containing protein n=1 Tax=Klebsiella oxytoca TaxID=571 RepID=UPI0015EA7681|nr:DUF551 domain-containing protein [Klebsiella oxytoca]QMF99454.1 DUF551 domain-containing protein [Klebsiella oxytoca]